MSRVSVSLPPLGTDGDVRKWAASLKTWGQYPLLLLDAVGGFADVTQEISVTATTAASGYSMAPGGGAIIDASGIDLFLISLSIASVIPPASPNAVHFQLMESVDGGSTWTSVWRLATLQGTGSFPVSALHWREPAAASDELSFDVRAWVDGGTAKIKATHGSEGADTIYAPYTITVGAFGVQ